MAGPQILTAATARSILLANDEHDFFRLYFFTTDLADFEQILRDAYFPGNVVAGYLTRAADENIAAAIQTIRIQCHRYLPSYDNPSIASSTAKSGVGIRNGCRR